MTRDVNPPSSNGDAARKWTPEQSAGITTVGTGLLLSAAAGSGKTAVLAERCTHLVCDAACPCNIDQLLVVTFTRAAAGEMRARIDQSLRTRLQKADDPRLHRQLALLERSQISTLHSFCATVLRRHFNRLGLDPNFRLLDEEEGQLLRLQTARSVLARHYDADDAGDFEHFIDTFGNGHDENLIDRILHLHALFQSLIDPEQWIDRSLNRLREAAENSLNDSELGRSFLYLLGERLSYLKDRCDQIERLIEQHPGCQPYARTVFHLRDLIERLLNELARNGVDGLSRILEQANIPTLRGVSKDIPGRDRIKSVIDELRKPLKNDGELHAWLGLSQEQWRQGIRTILPPANMLVRLVREFEADYQRTKDELRALDYGDLERLTLGVLRDPHRPDGLHPSQIARDYHREIRHVLVDEYQDINELQSAILTLVSTECLNDPQTPSNLFCVGDVKQSIYRFRLADPMLFINRYDAFRSGLMPGRVIDLRHNFRSRGPLLEALNHVFARLMTREAAEIDYDQSHHFVAGASYPPPEQGTFAGTPIELHLVEPRPRTSQSPEDDAGELENIEREAAVIVDRIRSLMGEGGVRRKVADRTSGYRPIEYRDIAILLRATQHKASDLAGVLRSAGIPVHNDSGTGFFESVEIRDMLALLSILDNQRQDIPLAAFLRSPLARLDNPDDLLARVVVAYPHLPFHRAVVLYARRRTDPPAMQLRDRLDQLARWRDLANRRSVADVLWMIYDQSGYLTFCAGLNDGRQRVANLIELHERARRFGTFQRQGLGRFRQFLDSLQDEQTQIALPSLASQADNVVRILSIHRAKGLEFPVVILPDLGKLHNLESSTGSILIDREGGMGMMVPDETRGIIYPSLSSIVVSEKLRRQTLAEELRVLYVAMTRAREHLILIGTDKLDADEIWQEHWIGHQGPMPPRQVLSSKSMLGWIGPAAVMANQQINAFKIFKHDDASIRDLSERIRIPPPRTAWQERLIRLQPLEPPPAPDPQADEVITRLTTPYPHARLARLRAAVSVTELTKQDRPVSPGQGQATTPGVQPMPTLALPAFLDPSGAMGSADLGTITHRALQLLDFAQLGTPEDLSRQIEQLVQRRMLPPTLAGKIDLSAIQWLLSTPLGDRLRICSASLLREFPIRFAMDPRELDDSIGWDDPRDRVMVRGVVDVLIPWNDGLVLVDYKTDRVTDQTIDARADFYRPQVRSYRQAVQKILNKPVLETWLVFLTARRLYPV